jgi:hypothetical protein
LFLDFPNTTDVEIMAGVPEVRLKVRVSLSFESLFIQFLDSSKIYS